MASYVVIPLGLSKNQYSITNCDLFKIRGNASYEEIGVMVNSTLVSANEP